MPLFSIFGLYWMFTCDHLCMKGSITIVFDTKRFPCRHHKWHHGCWYPKLHQIMLVVLWYWCQIITAKCKSNTYFREVFTWFCHWYLELTLQSMRPDYPSSLRPTPMVQPPIQALQMPMHLCDYTRLTYTTISSIWGEMTSNPILRQFSSTLWHSNTVRRYHLHCSSFLSSLIENWP